MQPLLTRSRPLLHFISSRYSVVHCWMRCAWDIILHQSSLTGRSWRSTRSPWTTVQPRRHAGWLLKLARYMHSYLLQRASSTNFFQEIHCCVEVSFRDASHGQQRPSYPWWNALWGVMHAPWLSWTGRYYTFLVDIWWNNGARFCVFKPPTNW